MAAVATLMYGGSQHMADLQQQSNDDQYLQTFYCRALYDYRSQDNSSLSFYRGDIIEVLTQLETGWWDGLLNDERGWFPSNYVQVISDQEAEAELSRSEYSVHPSEVHDSAIDVSQRVRGPPSEQEQDWYRDAMDYPGARSDPDEAIGAKAAGPSNDFWVPQVTKTGQIYYVNTQTGARSRDLPTELGEDVTDAHLAQVSSSPENRNAGRSQRVLTNGISREVNSPSTSQVPVTQASFGVHKRGGTPEPWVSHLADDGLTYYYRNTVTGQVQWTPPTATSRDSSHQSKLAVQGSTASFSDYNAQDTHTSSSRLRADSAASQNQASSSKRLSVYSDDSDVQPRDLDGPGRGHRGTQFSQETVTGPRLARYDRRGELYGGDDNGSADAVPTERSAMLLQQGLAPSEPETIEMLSELTREAIIAVMSAVDINGLPRGADFDKRVEQHVAAVVVAVRNLLYVSCALSGSLPNNLGERNSGDPTATAVAQQLQAQLKTSQRKVTATLSKLVLSARAARYKRELPSPDTLMRVEQDATDLQRAVDNFVAEVQKQYSRTAIKQLHARVGRRRLRGVFDLMHLGLGVPGAGVAASWKGFGFVNTDESVGAPRRTLDANALKEVKTFVCNAERQLSQFVEALTRSAGTADEIFSKAQDTLSHLMYFLVLLADINIAQEVDIDGVRREADSSYAQTVADAREMLRALEVSLQTLYDDATDILLCTQVLPVDWKTRQPLERGRSAETLSRLVDAVRVELQQSHQLLEGLLAVRQEQAKRAQSGFRGSMEWRASQLNIMDGNGRLSQLFGALEGELGEPEDVVDMDYVIRKAGARPAAVGVADGLPAESTQGVPLMQRLSEEEEMEAQMPVEPLRNGAPSPPRMSTDLPAQALEEEGVAEKNKPQPRAAKIRQLLGDDAPERYIDIANADSKPLYLRPDYNKDDLLLNPDGGIRAGTLPALVERLTSHDYGDPIFIRTFLMTYKSFTTLNELFDLLVARFNIQPPENLTTRELEEWRKMKQYIVRSRVLNTFKTMVMDEDVLSDDDAYILDRIKDFVSTLDVAEIPAAKTLSIVIERVKSGANRLVMQTPSTSFPPPSIIPKGMNKNKLKLLDIDPLEIARQLTLMESALYKKIRAIECLQRAREQHVREHRDHITDVIQITNKIANWVNDTVLSKEDSRKRAAIVRHFISVADRCRNMHNFSSMAAIISGLNSPPIRRLKRTWEQVSGRFMSQLGQCEMTLDSTKNFTNYKATLAKVNPPCIPFIGVYLTTLTFIQDGSKDTLPGNLINFGKRQKAAEVIREIKHWQSKDFLLNPLPPILAFIEEALGSFSDAEDWGEIFWNLSLEREPREREDEKMARLLQESGFL